MSRRTTQSIVANPVLVGAVTVLVVIVAVFLAYNANNGLPFVPTRQFKAQTESGAGLVKGNEVREGGFRIGVIERVEAVTLPDGRTVSEMRMKLDRKVGEVPVDTSLTIRPRSALGLKYVEFRRGSSARNLRDGDLIPLNQTTVPVQIDDVNKLFDEKTRRASQVNLTEFGNAFTGRGGDLNRTIEALPRLFGSLAPVMRNLADPQTQLGRFFRELGDAARVVAPLAQTQVQLFRDMATTFEAIARDPEALKATISKSPPTLDVAIQSFRVQRPFLNNLAAFSVDLRFAVRELRGALPHINPALEAGIRVLPRTPPMNRRLREVFAALRDLARAPGTFRAINGLVATVTTLNPQLRFLGPYQTVCNFWNYFWTYVAEHFSEPDQTGQAQRALLNSTAGQTNGIAQASAYEPANGVGYPENPNDPRRQRGDREFLHGQGYGAAVDNRGAADCEGGQRGYPRGPMATFSAPFDLNGFPNRVVFDSHTPGNQGPTFTGRTRVPAGQTFTREPGGKGVPLPQELTTGVYGG